MVKKMRVRYIGDYYKVTLQKEKIYDVISVENGFYKIMSELGETYYFPKEMFEIVEE